MIWGYKCFNNDLTNRYGIKFMVGKIYQVEGNIQFGNNGNGFHMCENLEDTLRYFDAINEEVKIGKVLLFGDIEDYEDEYNGFYNMHVGRCIYIEKILSREEIINYVLNLYSERVIRFISLFKLTKEEIIIFKNRFSNNERILDSISYYQEGDYNVYKKKKSF